MRKIVAAILNSVLMVSVIAIVWGSRAESDPLAETAKVSPVAAASFSSGKNEDSRRALRIGEHFSTYTTQPVWVHQCAQMSCGYHAKPAGSSVKNWCWVYNEGHYWDLVTTLSPWSSSVVIVGYVDEAGLHDTNAAVWCGDVGLGDPPLNQAFWLHSCDRSACGYGISPQFSAMSSVCDDAQGWMVVVDHTNPLKELAGFVTDLDWHAAGGYTVDPTWC
jgi:hypothetical protein